MRIGRNIHPTVLPWHVQPGFPALRAGWIFPLSAILFIAIWQMGSAGSEAIHFQFSSPADVVAQANKWLIDGSLLHHGLITLSEVLAGFTLGVSTAFIMGYAMTKNRTLAAILNPYIVGFQAVPIIAIAPVLILFFDNGTLIIAIISALIVFFPMLATTVVAIRAIDPNLRDIMVTLAATRWQTFRQLELPAALPTLMGGIRISIVLAVAGAVVGEAVRPGAGLGYLIYSARYVFNAAGVITSIFALIGMSLLLYGLATAIERRLLRWRERL
ncbi:MAG TPA: ABC transporter permease [Aggregatilineales bacterium]|nr:ABC transporter permease [Aggregatilineales bacterium]